MLRVTIRGFKNQSDADGATFSLVRNDNQKKILDLTQNNDQTLHDYEFDGIILDAPCSGSGTSDACARRSSPIATSQISATTTNASMNFLSAAGWSASPSSG